MKLRLTLWCVQVTVFWSGSWLSSTLVRPSGISALARIQYVRKSLILDLQLDCMRRSPKYYWIPNFVFALQRYTFWFRQFWNLCLIHDQTVNDMLRRNLHSYRNRNIPTLFAILLLISFAILFSILYAILFANTIGCFSKYMYGHRRRVPHRASDVLFFKTLWLPTATVKKPDALLELAMKPLAISTSSQCHWWHH